jgi:hypothetical protein
MPYRRGETILGELCPPFPRMVGEKVAILEAVKNFFMWAKRSFNFLKGIPVHSKYRSVL